MAERLITVMAPSWLLEQGTLDGYTGQPLEFSFPEAERAVFRRPKHEPADEWVPKNVIIAQGEHKGRLYSHDKTPHLRELMWAITQPCVREFYYAGASQGAMKSTLAYSVFAWFDVFQAMNALHCYPTESLAIRNNTERLQAIYTNKDSPKVLRDLRTGDRHDENKEFFRLKKAVHYFGYAGSDDTVKDLSAGLLHIDETDSDKYRGAHRKSLGGGRKTKVNYFIPQARKRVRNYSNYKGIFCSSVSYPDGFIWQGVTQECRYVFWYWVRCPYCTTLQPMRWSKERFVWPKDESGSDILWQVIKQDRLARYLCINDSCHHPEWDDLDRDAAARAGNWFRFEGDPEDEENFREPGESLRSCVVRWRPKYIGAIFPSWLCAMGTPSFSLSETVALYLKSRDKSLPLMDRVAAEEEFEKDHRSFPFRVMVSARPLSEAQSLIGEFEQGVVPGGNRVCALVAGVDTQSDHFYLSVWAIGYGINPEVWLIRRDRISTTDELTRELQKEYYTEDREYVFSRWHGNFFAGIDYMGNRHMEIWRYACSMGGFLVPTHGSPRAMNKNFVADMRTTYPGGTTPLPNGACISALRVNTKYYKDFLFAKSMQTQDSPGAIHFFKMDENDDFLHQWVSETRDKYGVWHNVKNKANHYWDTAGIAFCVADFMGLHTMEDPNAVPEIEIEKIVVGR